METRSGSLENLTTPPIPKLIVSEGHWGRTVAMANLTWGIRRS